jgi:hypothetical protein
MPDESALPEPNPNSIRLSCPECNGVVLPVPGNSAVQALEGHLERDHWYSWQLAHDTASEAFNKMMRVTAGSQRAPRLAA